MRLAGTIVRGSWSCALDQANGPSGDQWRAAGTDPFRAPSFPDGNGFDAPSSDPSALNFVEQARSSPELSGIVVAQGPGARERALIAEDVCRDVASPPSGYRVASEGDLGQIGLRPQDLSAIDTQFGARVYVRRAAGNSDIVIAFREQPARSRVLNLVHASGQYCTVIAARGLPTKNSDPAGSVVTNETRTSMGRAARFAAFDMSGELLSTLQNGGLRFQAALFSRCIAPSAA